MMIRNKDNLSIRIVSNIHEFNLFLTGYGEVQCVVHAWGRALD
jgi:hypothetical protein